MELSNCNEAISELLTSQQNYSSNVHTVYVKTFDGENFCDSSTMCIM